MLVLFFIFAKISYSNDVRVWRNLGFMAERTNQRIPVNSVETIKTLYEYGPLKTENKFELIQHMVKKLVDDGFGK